MLKKHGDIASALAADGKSFGAAKKAWSDHNPNSRKQHKWTEEEKDGLRRLSKLYTREKLYSMFNKEFNLHLTSKQIKEQLFSLNKAHKL